MYWIKQNWYLKVNYPAWLKLNHFLKIEFKIDSQMSTREAGIETLQLLEFSARMDFLCDTVCYFFFNLETTTLLQSFIS